MKIGEYPSKSFKVVDSYNRRERPLEKNTFQFVESLTTLSNPRAEASEAPKHIAINLWQPVAGKASATACGML